VNVSWQLPDGETCSSLGAPVVVVHFDTPAGSQPLTIPDNCDADQFTTLVTSGPYDVHAEATREDGTVSAASSTVHSIVPTLGDAVDIGPLLLARVSD
jgi:hypothetical protein